MATTLQADSFRPGQYQRAGCFRCRRSSRAFVPHPQYEPPIPDTIMNTISRYLVSQDRVWGSGVSIEEGGLIRVTTPVPLTEEERNSIGVSIFVVERSKAA